MRVFISNYYFHGIERQPGRKGGAAVAVRKGTPHNHTDYLPSSQQKQQGSAHLSVMVKFCLKLFINPQGVPGSTQTSPSSQALGINAFWQKLFCSKMGI
jgi:hypothetical protein